LEGWKVCDGNEKIKGFFSRLVFVAAPSGARESGVSIVRYSLCQSTFSNFLLALHPKTLETKELRRRRRGVAVIVMSLTGVYLAI
jgi:hypothetical protein